MKKLNPEKLSVELREGVTATTPILPRRYTLTHSDITAELLLTIARNYAYDTINPMRDELLGEWINTGEGCYYQAYVFVDGTGPFNQSTASIRNTIFRRELPLALQAIRFGDKPFFIHHPPLNHAPLFIHFISVSPQFNRNEYWGTFSDYEI
ncbi:Staygreen protein [Thalassobacillus cyri]|uniref:Staygreen protein n=1 Tax=Thalassobacillus cyri TaxID=571932 RepID=A0A1H3XFJ4_9BACI|nr:staygreen family protein [Thalassobacillus cyri]SDZ98195.1 Staygreen protein [Thalassobacillus cyri]